MTTPTAQVEDRPGAVPTPPADNAPPAPISTPHGADPAAGQRPPAYDTPVEPEPRRRKRRGRARPTTTDDDGQAVDDGPGLGWVLRHWRPDRRWFVPAEFAALAYIAAGVTVGMGLWPWLLIVPGLAATWWCWAAARRVYYTARFGLRQNINATALGLTAGLAATAWMIYAAHAALLALIPLAVLVVGTITLGFWWAEVCSRAPLAAEERAQEVAEKDAQAKAYLEERAAEVKAAKEALVAEEERIAAEQAEAERLATRAQLTEWEEIALRAAGKDPEKDEERHPVLKFVARTNTPGGYYIDFEDHPTKPIGWSGFQSLIPKMLSIASKRMAAYGIKLVEDMLAPEQPGAAHEFRLHVMTVPLPERIDYQIHHRPGNILDPRQMGQYKDRQYMLFPLAGNHGIMVGATGSGKSVFANNLIASVLECDNAEVQIGGTDKLGPLVFPWLVAWLRGRTDRPPFARVVGQDPQAVVNWLADLYAEAKRRNDNLGLESKHKPTRDEPAITAILEETAHLLDVHSRVKALTIEGNEWTAAQLINGICRIARSACISLFMLSQSGLMGALGPEGNETRRNLTIRVVGKTYSHSDGRDILTAARHVDSTRLHSNMLLVQPDGEIPRVMPGKTAFLDGYKTIAPVAEAYTRWRPEWTPHVDNKAWRERWNPERLPELARLAEQAGFTWPVEKGSPGYRSVGPIHPLSEARVNSGGQPVALDGGRAATVAPAATTATLVAPAPDPAAARTPAAAAPRTPASDVPASQPTTPKESKLSTAAELQQLKDKVEADMARAKEEAGKYGMLGEFMGRVFGVVNAENALPFISAGRLAHALDEVDLGTASEDEIDAAAQRVIDRMSAAPWNLQAVAGPPAGKPGWHTAAVLDRIRREVYSLNGLDPETGQPNSVPAHETVGVPAARVGDTGGTGYGQPSTAPADGSFVRTLTGQAVGPASAPTTTAGRLVAAINAKHADSDNKFITYTDAGALLNMSGSQLQQALGAEGLPLTRVRTEVALVGGGSAEGRPRGWYVADLRKRAAQG